MRRLLVANRGEIAIRIIEAAQKRGIETVLAASSADSDSLAAQVADRTIVIGAPQAGSSYLDASKLVHAALATGCEGIHPGYGFLSERADFAELVESNGLTFIGPTSQTIRTIGDKLSAREIARKANVPMASGTRELESVSEAIEEANRIGYPVITKASAGGGGRGMAVAHDETELQNRFDAASREAEQAFGDGRMYLERFIERARHIEVQVFGDGKGHVIHFGERDCSIQRRHQKMVEEAPAQLISSVTRERIHKAAVDLLSVINYRGAGTVEFLFDPDTDEFYFMEVNARLQVEHPVSEQISGVDLVDLQLQIASGNEFCWSQKDVQFSGHSIEVRILAEDPERDFLPSPGRITQWKVPQGEGIRLDTSVCEGSMVPPYYDSMIAKLIVTGDHRRQALNRLSRALDDFYITGIKTNVPLLQRLVQHEDFLDNTTSTRWLDTVLETLTWKETV